MSQEINNPESENSDSNASAGGSDAGESDAGGSDAGDPDAGGSNQNPMITAVNKAAENVEGNLNRLPGQ